MLQNYLKIAWRNLAKNSVFSAINIVGLSVGMTTAVLISLWVWDELSYDKYHQNYERIARVMQHQTSNGTTNTSIATPLPCVQLCRLNMPATLNISLCRHGQKIIF